MMKTLERTNSLGNSSSLNEKGLDSKDSGPSEKPLTFDRTQTQNWATGFFEKYADTPESKDFLFTSLKLAAQYNGPQNTITKEDYDFFVRVTKNALEQGRDVFLSDFSKLPTKIKAALAAAKFIRAIPIDG